MIRWLFSKTVREAVAMRKHVHRWYCAQGDLLSPQATGTITLALRELQSALDEPQLNSGRVRIKMEELEFAANKWLKPYPNPAWRENVEVLLVAIAVAMAIRTFFLQPFKIPTGSMQPTLYGVTSEPDFYPVIVEAKSFDANSTFTDDKTRTQLQAEIQADFNTQLKLEKEIRIPSLPGRIRDWFHGISYLHFVAPVDGSVDEIGKPWPPAFFSLYQQIEFAGTWHTIWFPPDYGEEPLGSRADLEPGRVFHQGDDVIKLRVHAGDHLFVDRLTYNFRPPQRGEIVVFDTHGITSLRPDQQDTFYIKRLVGLGGETLSLQQDYEVENVPLAGTQPVGHLVVDGRPLSASTPHFAGLYAFAGAKPGQKILEYQPNHYFGHAMLQALAPGESVQVETNHLFVMGDNTFNSYDSRYWGDFSSDHVIGKSFFVYWPITKRFGWGNQ
ncbi:MAG TPA: signal peptidase I [Candidatus Acidoferrales bacterium]|nr:signal peptidase I [Candidatus Acidoferrales bacterium]